MKLRLYNMAPDPVSTAYFKNSSNQSLRLWPFPLSFLGSCLVKYIPLFVLGNGSLNTFPRLWIRNNRRTVGRFIFCAVRSISKDTLWIYLYILLSLFIYIVKTFPRQWRIIGSVGKWAINSTQNSMYLCVATYSDRLMHEMHGTEIKTVTELFLQEEAIFIFSETCFFR
jgi:hypothetical protein